jgi:hypothetical protein
MFRFVFDAKANKASTCKIDTVIVQYGHLKVFQIVIENATDKNPNDKHHFILLLN